MGLFRKTSESFLDHRVQSNSQILPSGNPDPSNYTILQSIEEKHTVLLMLQYPDCYNYEGVKIILFIDTTLADLKKQKLIDPHFSNQMRYKHPFARFEPTQFGWKAARMMQHQIEGCFEGFVK